MSIGHCQSCQSALGPWEEAACLSCRAHPSRWFSNTLSALWVLEKARRPLSVYDVERGVRRELEKKVLRASLNVSLADDPRFCWAGKGIYGLFRHGLVPGARNLATVAKALLYSWDSSMDVEELGFVMRLMGYRFQQQSLVNALNYDDEVEWETWTAPLFERSPGARWRLVEWNVGPSEAIVDEIADMYNEVITNGLAERQRRLAS